MSNARAVIVGVGQVRNRPGLDSADWNPLEPAKLMAIALERAAADAGRPELLGEADFVGAIPPMAWAYDDLPGARRGAVRRKAARERGAAGRRRGSDPAPEPGREPDRRGRARDRAPVPAPRPCTAAAGARRGRDALGLDAGRRSPARRSCSTMKPFANALEQRHGVRNPVDMYPVYENALRARAGRSIDAHQRHVAALLRALLGGRGAQSALVVPRAAHGRTDRARRRAQSLDRLPVPEVHERDHGGRPGRGRDRDVGVGRGSARHRAREARALPRRRVGAGRLERGRARRPGVEPRDGRDRGADAGARRARRSPTSSSSICTAASRARSSSRSTRSVSRRPIRARRRRRAGSRTTADRATTTPCTAWPTPYCVCARARAKSAGSRAWA